MRISKETAQENKARVVKAACRLIREKGFEGLGVAEVMKEAGFTHGGFYNHFSSKEELGRAAIREAFDMAVTRVKKLGAKAETEDKRKAILNEYIGRYLSKTTRDTPGVSCPMAALGTDAARYEGAMKTEFADGVERYLADMQGLFAEAETAPREAIVTLATLVGALTLARSCSETNESLSGMILSVVREHLAEPEEAPTGAVASS
jgi:TetR/AcrR family transcriptional regulator, transcriptional repressor for nem operon